MPGVRTVYNTYRIGCAVHEVGAAGSVDVQIDKPRRYVLAFDGFDAGRLFQPDLDNASFRAQHVSIGQDAVREDYRAVEADVRYGITAETTIWSVLSVEFPITFGSPGFQLSREPS